MTDLWRQGNKFMWKRRKIGEVHGDRFVTIRKKGHFFKGGSKGKEPGFCICKELVDKHLKGKTIVVIYKGEKGEKVWKGSAEELQKKDVVQEGRYEKQYLIPDEEFIGESNDMSAKKDDEGYKCPACGTKFKALGKPKRCPNCDRSL